MIISPGVIFLHKAFLVAYLLACVFSKVFALGMNITLKIARAYIWKGLSTCKNMGAHKNTKCYNSLNITMVNTKHILQSYGEHQKPYIVRKKKIETISTGGGGLVLWKKLALIFGRSYC